jgi:hypothetical protein
MVHTKCVQMLRRSPITCGVFLLIIFPCVISWSVENKSRASPEREQTGPSSHVIWHREHVFDFVDPSETEEIHRPFSPGAQKSEIHASHILASTSTRVRRVSKSENVPCVGLCQFLVRVDDQGRNEGIHAKLIDAAAGRFVRYTQVTSLLPQQP